MSNRNYTDDSYALHGASANRMERITVDSGAWYCAGEVLTPVGIVSVYMEKGHASLRYAFRGRLYIRKFPRHFTARGIAAKAFQFARRHHH